MQKRPAPLVVSIAVASGIVTITVSEPIPNFRLFSVELNKNVEGFGVIFRDMKDNRVVGAVEPPLEWDDVINPVLEEIYNQLGWDKTQVEIRSVNIR